MKKFLFLAAIVFACAFANAQSRGGNWPTFGGDAQRSSWEGADPRLTKDTA
jgi:hypothetical protein